MSAADGLRLAMQWNRDSADRERQAKLDAVAAEEMQRKREDWARNDKIRTDTGALMAASLQGVDQDIPDETLGVRAQYGLAPQQGPAFNPRRDSQAADMGFGNEVAAGLAPPQAPTTIKRNSAAHKAAVEQMRWAQAAQNPDAFYKAKQGFDLADNNAQAAQLYQSVLAATPEQVSGFADKFTNNAHIKAKATVDPATKMTTISLDGGGAVQLDKIGMAKYVAGLWKLSKQDLTGYNDIASVDERLALNAKESFDALNKVTGTNNTAMNMGLTRAETARHNRVSEGNSAAELGLRQTAANKPHYYQLVDGQGQAQMVNADKLVEKDGVLQLPPGMKYPSQKAPVNPEAQQKYRDAMMELGPQPPTGTQQAKDWMVRKDYIDQIYGVSAQGSAFEQALQAKLQGKQNAAKAPADPRSVPPAPGTYRVLQSMGRDALVFMPDGSQYTANPDQLEKLRSFGYKQE